MTHPVFRDLLLERISSVIGSASAVKGISHLGLRGRAREVFANDLLSPLLLSGQIVGTGAVVDSRGQESGQTDIVVFDKSVLPPELFNESEGLFPIEASAYAIEVKSQINSQELKDSLAKAKRLWTLYPLVDGFRPIPAIFAFGSDLKGVGMVDELERYAKVDPRWFEFPAVRVICIANKGYAYFESKENAARWNYLNSDGKSCEMANFLGGLANTLPDFRKNRTASFVRYGQYLLSPVTFKRFGSIEKE
jgi:hypothetical protein